jgi:hypothetical protein
LNITDPTTHKVTTTITVVISNKGGTPTGRAFTRMWVQIVPNAPASGPDRFPRDPQPGNDSFWLLNSFVPNDDTEINLSPDISQAQMRLAMAGKARVFFWGTIEYLDAFDDTPCHRYRFYASLLPSSKFYLTPKSERPYVEQRLVWRDTPWDDKCEFLHR